MFTETPFTIAESDSQEMGYPAMWRPRTAVICGSGSALPATRYTQAQVKDLLGIAHPIVHKLLAAPHIQSRHLYLPETPGGQRTIADESHEDLNRKFDEGVLDIGVAAAARALADSPFRRSEIDFLICVTSSGFRVPGVSSVLARALGFRQDLYRLDVVGMGCNAGMSALRTADALARTGQRGLLVCCEINSAIYVRDESVRTGIVNSLFGDGAAAFVLAGRNTLGQVGERRSVRSEILAFQSYTIPEQVAAMRFDWDEERKKWSFCLSKQIPFVVGENLQHPVRALLNAHGLKRSQIRHWILHTGGAAVIEGAKRSLGLDEHDVRHTRSVLRDYGNISSGSFLVSYQRLVVEGSIRDQDLGVMAAMGPGATLEACLVRYHVNE